MGNQSVIKDLFIIILQWRITDTINLYKKKLLLVSPMGDKFMSLNWFWFVCLFVYLFVALRGI